MTDGKFGPKSRIDVGAAHRERLNDLKKEMKVIEDAKPDDYFNDPQWRKLNEECRQENRSIESYERSLDRGAKF